METGNQRGRVDLIPCKVTVQYFYDYKMYI